MLLLDDGKIRMRVIEKPSRQDHRRSHRRRHARDAQGHLHARYASAHLPADRKGPRRPRPRLEARRRLDRAVVRAARRGPARGAQARSATRAAILAKIEKPSAIADLDAIIAASDGIMVARGDLGVEMPVEKVPGLQKKITRMARAAGKPVIVATQMLESMISSPDADARRSLRRRDRRVRRRRRRDAVGRKRDRAVPARGHPDDGPHRHRGGSTTRATTPILHATHTDAAADRRRRHRACRVRHRRHREARRHRLLHGDGLDRAARHPRAPGHPDHRPDARSNRRRGGCRSPGACSRS